MPMKSKAIAEGTTYIGESGELLRTVVSISDQQRSKTIVFHSFGAQDGAYIAERMCDLAAFARWAARPATLAEDVRHRSSFARMW